MNFQPQCKRRHSRKVEKYLLGLLSESCLSFAAFVRISFPEFCHSRLTQLCPLLRSWLKDKNSGTLATTKKIFLPLSFLCLATRLSTCTQFNDLRDPVISSKTVNKASSFFAEGKIESPCSSFRPLCACDCLERDRPGFGADEI